MARKTVLLILATVVLIAPAAVVAHPVSFVTAGEPRRIGAVPPLVEVVYTARVGQGPFDRIGLHHLRPRRLRTDPSRPVVLYLPGTNMNGELPLTEPNYWLPLYLAVHGIDVWSMDYRTHFVPADTPPARLVALADWTDGVFTDDVVRAASFIMTKTHAPGLFIAGFSKGAEFAYLYAAHRPHDVRGLVILDGYIFGGTGGNRRAKTGGPARYAQDIGGRHLTYARRQALLRLVIRDPQAPAPLPQFKTAASNLEHVVYAAAAFGGHGGLANPYGGFSDPVVLARVLLTYDRYWPAVQAREVPMTPALAHKLEASGIPVIAFASTNIGSRWTRAVKAFAAITNGSSTVVSLPEWGHLDVLCGIHAARRVYAPVLAFIRRRAGLKDSRGSHHSMAAGKADSRPGPRRQSTGR